MPKFTDAEVREAALTSLDLTEKDLGTAKLTVIPEPGNSLAWTVVYGDSGGTFEAEVTVEAGPRGESPYLVVAWDDESDDAEFEAVVHEPVRKIENPETGEAKYPLMASDGSAILENGAVAECDCPDCLAKYDATS